MHTYTSKKLQASTIEYTVTIPAQEIAKESESAFETLREELTVVGFRKGKAPREIAKKQIHNESVFQEMLKSLLPRIYEDIVKKESLKPIITPKVELVSSKEGEDWKVKITTAEKPPVNLGNYKEYIKKAKEQVKKADIWVPGKDSGKPEDTKQKEQQNQQKLINEVMTALLKNVSVEIPELLIEEELNQRLTRILDDVQKIGLTVDAYLKSKNITMEELKTKARQEIVDTYKLEFILNEIADSESVKVEKEDLDKILSHITDVKERAVAEQNAYFYAAVLRKQKTLDLLLSL